MKELIVFTHNDLDALGCMLNIEFKMPNIPKKYFHTNYANINEVVAEIEQFLHENQCTHILIADVSFSNNKQALQKLYSCAKITLIDHHLYPDGFWDDFPDMKVVHDKTKSATKLCNEFFRNTGANPGLDKLTHIIDVYDIWQTSEPHFDVSQDLNEYFWASINYGELLPLVNRIVSNGFKLPGDFTQVTSGIRTKRSSDIQSYEDRQLIHRAGDVTVCFVNEWFNHILINEMRQGKNFVIGVTPKGIIRVRIREESPYSSSQKNSLRMHLTGTEDTGHMNAFTYKPRGEISFDALVNEVKRITGAIDAIMKNNH